MSGFIEPFAISLGVSLFSSLVSLALTPSKTQKAGEVNLNVPKSDYGSPLPKIYGRVRIEGNKFWPDTKDRMYEVVTKKKKQGKGGGTTVETKEVFGTFAVLFCEGQVSIERVILNGNQIETSHNFYQSYCTFFDGTQTTSWSEMQNLDEAPYKDIAYTKIAYIGFNRMPLDKYGNTIPQQVGAVLLDQDLGAQPTLDLVVNDICLRAGLSPSSFDVSELSSFILRDGLIVSQSGEGYRKTIEELMQFYLFTAVETNNGVIAFRKFDRGAEIPLTINPKHFIPKGGNGIENKLFVKTEAPKQNLPNKISLTFTNQNQNWNRDTIVEYFEEFTKENIISIDSQLTSYPYEIKERLRLILKHLYLRERQTYTFSIFGSYINDLELLRLIELPNGEIVQVDNYSIGANFQIDITAKYYAGQTAYDYSPTDNENAGTPPTLYDPTNSLPSVYVLDIPQVESFYAPNTLYIFADKQCSLNVSVDGGLSYTQTITHEAISVIGDCTSALPNVTGLDTVNSVDVTLTSGNIETVTSPQFDSGLNLALLGVLDPDGFYSGKLIKFRDVVINSPNNFTISYLAQGEFGTSSYDTSSLPLKFFLLKAPTDAYYSTVRVDPNKSLSILPVVAAWQNIGLTPVTTFTSSGNSYKPSPVYNVTSLIDIDDNIQISWDYVATVSPYNNSQENITFEIDIIDSGVVRTLTTNTKKVIYFNTLRSADLVGIPFEVKIYGVSSVVGRGFESSNMINPTSAGDIVFGGSDTGYTGTHYITADYTVTEDDNRRVLIVTNPNPTFINLTFPATLPNGFECVVINDVSSDISARVKFLVPTLLSPADNEDILRGSTAIVSHISLGNYFVLANNRKFLQVNELNYDVKKVWNFTQKDAIDSVLLEVDETDFDKTSVIFSLNDTYVENLIDTLSLDAATFNGQLPAFYLDRTNHTGTQSYTTITGLGTAALLNVGTSANQIVQLNASALLPAVDGSLLTNINAVTLNSQNSSYYLSRANHTGTQSYTTITGLATVASSGDYDDLSNKPVIDVVPDSQTTNYSLVAGDYGKFIRVSNSITITLPNGLVTGFTATIQNIGTGTITFSATGTLQSAGTTLIGQYLAVQVYHVGSNVWTVVGALS